MNALITEVESVSSDETRRIVGRNRGNSAVKFVVNAKAQRRDGRRRIVFITGAVVKDKDGASPRMTVGRP
jgi:hypothetical protein